MESSTSASKKIEDLLLPLLEDSDMFVVSIKITAGNNVKVYLDADSGLNISKCATVNRKLNHLLEESGIFPVDDYSIEVSSPGIDEPLISMRQYQKNIGRTVEVTPLEGTELLGILKEVTDDKIIIHVKGQKKKEPEDIEVPFSFIKKTVVQVTF